MDKITGLPEAPEFILHTGDISHLSQPSEFDNVAEIVEATNKRRVGTEHLFSKQTCYEHLI